MKILSFNVWGNYGPPERQLVLRKAIRSLNADILCLQEVAQKQLLDELELPHTIYAPESELAIASRFPFENHQTITFQIRSPLENHVRQAIIGEIKFPEGPLTVVTTHLAWKADDESTRLAQTKELTQAVEPIASPIVIGGDFNAEPTDSPIVHMKEQGFVDLFEKLHPNEAGITWDNQTPFIQSHSARFPNRRVDYLFLKETSEISRFARDDKLTRDDVSVEVVCNQPNAQGLYPSDHFGVLATLNQ